MSNFWSEIKKADDDSVPERTRECPYCGEKIYFDPDPYDEGCEADYHRELNDDCPHCGKSILVNCYNTWETHIYKMDFTE